MFIKETTETRLGSLFLFSQPKEERRTEHSPKLSPEPYDQRRSTLHLRSRHVRCHLPSSAGCGLVCFFWPAYTVPTVVSFKQPQLKSPLDPGKCAPDLPNWRVAQHDKVTYAAVYFWLSSAFGMQQGGSSGGSNELNGAPPVLLSNAFNGALRASGTWSNT